MAILRGNKDPGGLDAAMQARINAQNKLTAGLNTGPGATAAAAAAPTPNVTPVQQAPKPRLPDATASTAVRNLPRPAAPTSPLQSMKLPPSGGGLRAVTGKEGGSLGTVNPSAVDPVKPNIPDTSGWANAPQNQPGGGVAQGSVSSLPSSGGGQTGSAGAGGAGGGAVASPAPSPSMTSLQTAAAPVMPNPLDRIEGQGGGTLRSNLGNRQPPSLAALLQGLRY